MKKLLIFVIVLTVLNFSIKAQVSKKEVITIAKNFLSQNRHNNLKSTLPSSPKVIRDAKQSILAYVLNLKPRGYIIVAPSKAISPIIAFSYQNNFDFTDKPNNILLNILKQDMEQQLGCIGSQLSEEAMEHIARNKSKWNDYSQSKLLLKKATSIQYGPLLSDIWGGVNCYDQDSNTIYTGNYFTPNHYSPGCVATSLSQILNYLQWPENGTASHTDYDNSGNSQGNYYANFANTTYDYAHMLDNYQYEISSDEQRRAMGLLAYHCGIALDMDYENYGSTSNINRTPAVLNNYFRATSHYEDASWYYFWPRLRANLEDGYPVQFALKATNGAGHAMVCDGYQIDNTGTKFYHLNMGWWGACNNWYNLQASFSACGYSIINGAVFDIHPNPLMKEAIRSNEEKKFTLSWRVSQHLSAESFEIEQSFNGGAWTIVAENITDTIYSMSVADAGLYQFRVRAKINGGYYINSYSNSISVVVKDDLTFLDFDGDDSFFIRDNANNDLDISSNWTIETWIKIDNRTSGTYPVVLDRQNVFSMYLISDIEGDYGIRFVARNSSGSITASVRSDYSSTYMYYNEWNHIALTRDAYQTRLFINGHLVDSSTDIDFNLSASTKALNVGARYWGSYERYLDGKIDGLSISSRAKYINDFTPIRFDKFTPDAYTKLLISMDEGTGTALEDASENFTGIALRSSPNLANWMFESYTKSASTKKGIKETKPSLLENIEIYPLPAQNYLFLRYRLNTNQDAKLQIFDLNGRNIKTIYFQATKGLHIRQFDIENLKNGIYFLQFISQEEIVKKKLIINK